VPLTQWGFSHVWVLCRGAHCPFADGQWLAPMLDIPLVEKELNDRMSSLKKAVVPN